MSTGFRNLIVYNELNERSEEIRKTIKPYDK